eukprot:8684463-Pyramimonas_sp.AAC.1
MEGSSAPDPKPPAPSGILQPIAAKVLLKILRGARMARPDLLNAVCKTAACVTKWTEEQGTYLFRIICYLKATANYRPVSWVCDRREDAWLRQFADADLA